jgi:hypothetical protein
LTVWHRTADKSARQFYKARVGGLLIPILGLTKALLSPE